MQEISSSGVVTYFGGGGLNYGEIWAQNSTVLATSTGGKKQVTAFANNGLSNGGITPQSSANNIAVGVKGTYDVNCSIAVANNSAQTYRIEFSLWTNGGTTELNNVSSYRTLVASSTDVGSMSLNGLCAFSSSDTVELWASLDTTAVRTYTVRDVTLNIKQIGGSTA